MWTETGTLGKLWRFHSCRSWTSLTCLSCSTTGAGWSRVQKTAQVPQLQCSDKVLDVPVVQVVAWACRVLRAGNCGIFSQLRYLDKVIDVFFVQFIDGCGRPCAHAETWSAFSSCTRSLTCPLCSTTGAWGLTVQKTVEFRSCSADKVVDVPVCAVHRRLWTSL